MDFEEASEILSTAVRSELRDHAFGDREINWVKEGQNIAGGYFGGNYADVWIGDSKFSGEEARQLAAIGLRGVIERNDEVGPDTYEDGVIMPGLTLEGVREELTGE
jgi:hypothetical protein